MLDAALSSRIDRCRSGGLEVVLEAMDAEVDVDRAAPCLRLLDRILDLEEKLDAVMVRLPDVGGGPGQVRVLPPLALPDLEAVLRGIEGGDHDVRHDHFSTVVRVGDLQQSPDAEVVTPW